MELRHAFKIFIRKHEEKSQLGRSGHEWEDNIKIDLKEIVC
jgi:hypothetical protein